MLNWIKHILLFLLCLSTWQLVAQQLPKVDTSKQVTMRGTFYHDRFVGRKTSSGQIFSQDKFTAAHHSYKFGTLLLVTNPSNGKQIIVRVNDRCPHSNIIDMTRRAASLIDVKSRQVRVLVLPDSYLPVWENIEQYLDILEQGKFLEVVQQGITSLDRLSNDRHLYDLELMTATSRAEAEKKTSVLPIYYQDKLNFKHKDNKSDVDVVLEVSLPRYMAESVVKELKPLFPDAKIIKSE